MKLPMLPCWSICRPSLAKVEKVVKPPQKPVVSRRNNGEAVLVCLVNRA